MTRVLLEGLNPAQRSIVEAPLGHALVLAGAGSGKTKTLTHRIGYLLSHFNARPSEILSVTFTNKAAKEMQNRLEKLLSGSQQGMWAGTFHGLCHRWLRLHFSEAGLDEHFHIMDSDDQLKWVKRILKELDLSDEEIQPRDYVAWIGKVKDEGYRSHQVPQDFLKDAPMEALSVYRLYEEKCEKAGVVDFAELLMRALELFQNNKPLCAHYQQRFKHLFVDEFQDTNRIQYELIRILAAGGAYVFAVGDDDQAIYGWRGAKVENVRNFLSDFKGAKTYKLEQNYRSTSIIIEAANAVIANNKGRLGKSLWTETKEGNLIDIMSATDEIDEASGIAERIKHIMGHRGGYQDHAILYRNNALSRPLEEALMRRGLPYKIYGGLKFFERAEVKDAMAWLKMIINPHDDSAFERAIATPTRGVGEKSLDAVRISALRKESSLWKASGEVVQNKEVPNKALQGIKGFHDVLKELRSHKQHVTLDQLIERTLKVSGLMEHHKKEGQSKNNKDGMRVENLEELVSVGKRFLLRERPEGEEGMDDLVAFLTYASLEAAENGEKDSQDAVQLMTLHASKGLEFPHVYIIACEDSIFPSANAIADPQNIEEERRLMYVGMTRAMKTLTLSFASGRRMYGSMKSNLPSRFLSDIPNTCFARSKAAFLPTGNSSQQPVIMAKKNDPRPTSTPTPNSTWRLGQAVRHAKFGEGVVFEMEGVGPHLRLRINFEDEGSKWLMPAYTQLFIVDQ